MEIRSTESCRLSSIEKTFAKKPWDIDLLFEWTLMTVILSLIVTAVGRFGVFLATKALELLECLSSLGRGKGSGKMMVPFPREFLTFLIRSLMGGFA